MPTSHNGEFKYWCERAEKAEKLLDYICDKIYDWYSDCDCYSVESMRECIAKIEQLLEQRM